MIFREATKKEIVDALEESILGKYAFDIEFPDESKSGSFIANDFTTKYIGNAKCFFKISEKYNPEKKKNGFNLTFSPGYFLKDEEVVFVEDFPETMKQLRLWLSRLVSDLKDISPLLNNVYEEIHRIEEDFEKKLNEKFEPNDKSYFSPDEIQELKGKMDGLFSQFEKLKEENEIKASELKAIKQELEKLKTTLPILPKTAWYKSSGKKIINLIGKYLNPDTIKAIGIEVVKGLINDGK